MSCSDIAVVIPVYNASRTIIRALESVFNQTLLPAEVIIVDDGSTDDSITVINQSGYKHLVSLISVANGGPSLARNIGIKASKSKYIALLDADDEWIFNDKLKQQLAIIESSKRIVLVDTFAKVYWDKDKVHDMTLVKSGNEFARLLYDNTINATSSVLIRRSAIEEAGYFDTEIRFGEDRLLWALLAKLGEFATLEEFAVYKENHLYNLTAKGEENFKYRQMVVSKLLSQSTLSRRDEVKIKLANIEHFLLLGFRRRDAKMCQKCALEAYSEAPLYFLFSRLSVLYIASFFFRFFPKT
jgi:glycosyltransferase involved in cell wall biosynthesis